ncbi:FUSC family protein [Xanthomarina sp. GH4-25]|uniref:FUSC family protein n=1 Tax=Xanthomarina sp. GH4-25 TaxID=3349335 RepID=UPI000D677AE0|nr:FUSC family protein [Flavobacteriaceae bacterium LYZ1037]
MKKLCIVLGLIAAVLALILSVLPVSNLAFFPAIVAFIFALGAFYFSNKENSSKKTVQLIFLLTIISLSISTYKSLFNTVEVGNTEELQEREQKSEENAIEELEGLDFDEMDLEDVPVDEIDIEEAGLEELEIE